MSVEASLPRRIRGAFPRESASDRSQGARGSAQSSGDILSRKIGRECPSACVENRKLAAFTGDTRPCEAPAAQARETLPIVRAPSPTRRYPSKQLSRALYKTLVEGVSDADHGSRT